MKSIVDLAHNLGLKVVAEGVEDRVSWERLERMGCDIAQGYYLSRPIPGPQLTAYLQHELGDEPRAHDAGDQSPITPAAARKRW